MSKARGVALFALVAWWAFIPMGGDDSWHYAGTFPSETACQAFAKGTLGPLVSQAVMCLKYNGHPHDGFYIERSGDYAVSVFGYFSKETDCQIANRKISGTSSCVWRTREDAP